jgi:hypothetical protein
MKFKGDTWERFGEVLSSDAGVNAPESSTKEIALRLFRRAFSCEASGKMVSTAPSKELRSRSRTVNICK